MCWMKRFKYIGCIAFVLTCFAANSSASETVVAIVYNEPAEENFDGTPFAEVFKEELRALTSGEFDLRFKSFPAQWDTEATTQALDAAYADSIVDMVLVVGFLGNQIAVARATFTKPTFLPMVINAELMGAPTDGNRSGKRNLSYLVDSVPFKDNITTFRRLVPFNRLVLLLDSAGLEVLVRAPALLSQQVPDISVMFIGHDISQGESLAIDIPDSAEAVILGGLPRLNQEQLTEVLRSFADRGIPVFSQSEYEVHSGALASFAIDTDYIRIARRNALNMQSVLLGQKAEDQRIYYEGRRRLTINMQTADILGVSPGFDLLSEANLVNTPVNQGPEYDLLTVAQLAIERNLDLAIEQANVSIGEQDLSLSRAPLLPQLTVDSSLLNRDQSPNVQAGLSAERSADAAITFSQTLYSDVQRSGYQQQKHLQAARLAALKAATLNSVQEATVAYLRTIRTEAQVLVQQDNLNLTRTNLDLAKDRVRIGISSNADIYRWQSNLASAQSNVLTAIAEKDQARDNLNRLLNQPLDAPFRLKAPDIQSLFAMTEGDFNDLVNNPRQFSRFVQFSVKHGLALSPELDQLRRQIAAIERDIVQKKRAHWLPDFNLQAQYSDNLDMSGFGSGGLNEGLTDWSVAVNVRLPLFTGGSRRAALSKSQLMKHQLSLQLLATQQRVSQNIRARMYVTQASYANIELSNSGAVAARKNLELILENYRAGSIGILDLLDAQTQSLQAELAANNALHDFLINLMNVQRAVGRFEFMSSEPEKQALVDEVTTYLNDTSGLTQEQSK